MKALLLAAALAFAEGPKPAPGGALKILSFNAAGIPIVHGKIGRRMKAIGERLAQDGYDVVALQEVWRDRDADRLAAASGLPYRARSRQAWLVGDGLLILSRFPVREFKSLRFTRRTRRWLRLDGEQLAHKGAILARIDAPGGPLDVYDVHFVADYKKYHNREVRLSQASEFAAWVKAESAGRPAVIAGDLNMTVADTDFGLLTERLGFVDGCRVALEDACGASRADRRIDFVLLSAGSPRPEAAGAALDGAVQASGREYPLSDHLGIAVRAALPLAPLQDPAPSAALAR